VEHLNKVSYKECGNNRDLKCKLIGPNKELESLNREYDNFQHYLKTGGIYSATKQQGKRTQLRGVGNLWLQTR